MATKELAGVTPLSHKGSNPETKVKVELTRT